VSVTLLDDSLQSLLTLPSDTTSLYLPGAPIDATGKTGQATKALSVVNLEQSNVVKLDRAGFLLYTIELSFPDGVVFSNIVSADSVNIKAWGTFRAQVNR